MLIDQEITSSDEPSKDKAKKALSLIKGLIDEHLLNEEVYGEMKSNSKFKFLHIGFSLIEVIIKDIEVWDPKAKHREPILEALLSSNFLRVLVKNISNVKAQLHD